MTVAAPTGSPSPSIMSSFFRPNISIVIWQGMNSTPIAWAKATGNELVEQTVEGGVYRFVLRKK